MLLRIIETKTEETEGVIGGTARGIDVEEITTQEAIMAGILIVIGTKIEEKEEVIETGTGRGILRGAVTVIRTEAAHLYNTPMALRSRYEKGVGQVCERITSVQ